MIALAETSAPDDDTSDIEGLVAGRRVAQRKPRQDSFDDGAWI